MWIEAILTKDDVSALVRELTPVQIHLGGSGSDERFLYLGRPSEVALVPGKGVRIDTRAKVRWPVLGVDVPITILSLRALLRPEIEATETSKAGRLLFHLEIEEADLKNVPAMIDRAVTSAVNTELAAQRLAWDFTETLSHAFELPRSLPPLDRIALAAQWGEVKVTEEALVFAASFRATVARDARSAGEDVADG